MEKDYSLLGSQSPRWKGRVTAKACVRLPKTVKKCQGAADGECLANC